MVNLNVKNNLIINKTSTSQYWLFFFSWLTVTNLSAQSNLDSLFRIWQNETAKVEERADAFEEYIWDGFLFNKPDSAFLLSKELLQFSITHNLGMGQIDAHNLQGVYYAEQGRFVQALISFRKCRDLHERLGDKEGELMANGHIGIVLREQGQYLKAIEIQEKMLRVAENLEDDEYFAITLSRIGDIYNDLGQFDKSLEYFERSLAMTQNLPDNEAKVAELLERIGNVYYKLGDFSKSADYLKRALEKSKAQGLRNLEADCLEFFGNISFKEGRNQLALGYLQQSIAINTDINRHKVLARQYKVMGKLHLDKKQYQDAKLFCQKSYEVSVTLGLIAERKEACACLVDIYKVLANDKKALNFIEEMLVLEDSLHTDESARKLQQMEFSRQLFEDSLKQEEAKLRVALAHKQELAEKDKTRNALIGGGLLLMLLALTSYQRYRYTAKAKAQIQKEKDRSEELLLNILPAEIADELKIKGYVDAKQIEQVTVLFTDFEGFTALSESMQPQNLVNLLNECFSAFDQIMEKYQIEKIKTIGDAYMAASGLHQNKSNHAETMVKAALEINDFIKEKSIQQKALQLPFFNIRIGIHTGPLVAGIVGLKKFQYDIWGDTVNTAQRLEAAGAVGQVNISKTTFNLIKNQPDFSFYFRGQQAVKGKGKLDMYFVSSNM